MNFSGEVDFLLVNNTTIWRYISFHVLLTRIIYNEQFQRYACFCNTNNTMKENTTVPWLLHLLLLLLKFPDLKYRCLHLQTAGTSLANKVQCNKMYIQKIIDMVILDSNPNF